MVCYLVSDWKSNKVSPRIPIETITKKWSYTSCPMYFDDVKSDKFINKLSEGFDDGEAYETAEGIFPKRAEVFFSANYFAMDEEATSDSERTCDRLSVIPFQEWEFMPASEFSRRQNLFRSVVESEVRPTEFVIGEIGNFINSSEFKEKSEEFAQWLYDKAEVIKIRTLLTNWVLCYSLESFPDLPGRMGELGTFLGRFLGMVGEGTYSIHGCSTYGKRSCYPLNKTVF